MLTLTPGVDLDLDLVNARVRDGTIPSAPSGVASFLPINSLHSDVS